MTDLSLKYSIEYLTELSYDKSKITECILKDIREYHEIGKELAINVLSLRENEKCSDIHIKEFKKCSEDIMYFKNNYLIHLKDDEVQNRFIKSINQNNRVRIIGKRQTKKSYAYCINVLHSLIFDKNKTIGIVSPNYASSKAHINQIAQLCNLLPSWMKMKIKINKTSITTECNVKVLIDTISEKSFRGISLNTLIVDDLDWINGDKLNLFLESVIPSLYSTKNNKIILIGENEHINKFEKIMKNKTIFEIIIDKIKNIITFLYDKISK